METKTELMRELCERAGVRGRRREVLVLLAAGMAPVEVGAHLGMAVGTVYAHKHEGWRRIAAAKARWDEREFHRFVLSEGILGPAVSKPKPGLYRNLPDGGGERISLHAGPLVTVEDLVTKGAR